ncbi:MAG: YD repeat-containing protein [Lachnospiraceae bacterium]|nr:YD repeat-containing protein [Lachnospiraceae bacterium]
MESYLYDHTGNITSVIDGEGNITQYTYGLSQNVVCITDPTGKKEQYQYDKEGHLIEKTDRNNITPQFAFNIYGVPLYRRVKNRILEESYQYTPEGFMKAAISSGMYYSYEYNKMGQIAKKSVSGRTLLTYNYDLNENLIHQKDVTGKVTEYTYNGLDGLRRKIPIVEMG